MPLLKDKILFPPTGKIDSDSDVRVVQKGDIIDAENCRWGFKNDGTVGSVENIPGFDLLGINLPSGSNIIIGSCPDYENGYLIYFLFNSENKHCIMRINIATDDVSPILWQEPALLFGRNHLNNPFVLDGWIYWTDQNGLRHLNIDLAVKATYANPDNFTEIGIGVWAIIDDFVVG